MICVLASKIPNSFLANNATDASRGSVNIPSKTSSIPSNNQRGSTPRSKSFAPNQENYNTYKLDEDCSVVDKSMKYEGFGQLYKHRPPFVAERTVSRDSTYSLGRGRSPRRFQSSEMRLPTPPRTPSYTESQDSNNFIVDNKID